VCAQFPQLHVATGHPAFVGKVRMNELEQIALIEQRQLQRVALHERADLGALERRDPVEPIDKRLHDYMSPL
jgi:hypothetical protein